MWRKRYPTWEQLEDQARDLGWRAGRIGARRRFTKGRMGIQVGRVRAGWKITYFYDNVLQDADIGREEVIKTLLYEHLGTMIYF